MAVAAGFATACGTGSVDVAFDEPTPTLFADDTMVETTDTTTTAPVGVDELDLTRLPEPVPSAPGVVVLDGIAAPVTDRSAGTWTIATPCGGERTGIEPAVETAVVVLDPAGDAGEGGDPAAVERNHRLATAVQRHLADAGISVLVTRGALADIAATYRADAADAAGARVLISFALTSGEGEPGAEPALELVHPAADTEGRRLAGLVHAAVRPVLDDLASAWPADVEPGVRAVLNQRGTDYFTVLRDGSVAARIVLHLPVDPAGDLAADADPLAAAVADAVARFLVTADEGDGFVVPVEVVRDAPTAGGAEACLDPLAVESE